MRELKKKYKDYEIIARSIRGTFYGIAFKDGHRLNFMEADTLEGAFNKAVDYVKNTASSAREQYIAERRKERGGKKVTEEDYVNILDTLLKDLKLTEKHKSMISAFKESKNYSSNMREVSEAVYGEGASYSIANAQLGAFAGLIADELGIKLIQRESDGSDIRMTGIAFWHDQVLLDEDKEFEWILIPEFVSAVKKMKIM